MPHDFLAFRLWAPMAAWGDIAVGERRGSWGRPSRSAILGLIAAALGIERSDAVAHQELEDALGFAVRVDNSGRPLRDYHTAQSPSSKRGVRWATRRDELNPKNDLNTILSERQYYLEMEAVIALWVRQSQPFSRTLAEISAALAAPTFTLYLGRKSCPPGLPIKPHHIAAESPLAAFRDFDLQAGAERANGPDITWGRPRQSTNFIPDIWMGGDDARAFGLAAQLLERTSRRDSIRDRSRWLFSDRAEVRVASLLPASSMTEKAVP